MGLLREPKGVDFVIQSPSLTEKDKNEISEFIQSRKKIAVHTSSKRISTPKTTKANS